MQAQRTAFYAEFVRFAWPLTGRTEEMRAIEDAIASPDLAGIVVCGAAGVGKSRVVREALTTLTSQGCATRWAVATSSAQSLPLGAFSAWADSESSDSLQLVRGVVDSLTAGPPGANVVVGVDDAHLLDNLSSFVLHQIVQRRAAKVVLTVRDGEPIPTATREVWKGGQFERLDLQPLSRDELTNLLSAALGAPINPDAAQRLWKLTGGNPLYLRNIVEREVADGRLAPRNGYWHWTGDPIVPPNLVELIESRIGALPDSTAEVIDLLAVGEPIGLRSLRRMAGTAAVEDADIRGLTALDHIQGRVDVRLAHPLYGELRRNRAAALRLRRLRGLVAEELGKSDDGDDMHVVVRRATLSLDSDLELDADLLITAARGAIWLWDLPLADRLAGAAMRAGGGAEANLIRAYALSCLGSGDEADDVLAGVPSAKLSETDQGRLAFLRAVNNLFTLADPAGAKQLIDDASRDMTPQARTYADAFLAVYWAAMGKPDAVRTLSEKFDWAQLADLVARRMTAWARAVAAADAGRTTDAVAAAEAGYPVPMRSFVIITDAHASALLMAGRIAEAELPAEMLRQRTSVNPVSQYTLIGTALAGRAALGAGRLQIASSLIGPVAEALSASGNTNGWGYRCQLPLTLALAMRGSVGEATAALGTLEKLRHPSWRYLDYEFAMAQAWVAAAQGAVSEAIRTVVSAAETARGNGQFAAEVMCLQTATQFGDGAGAARLHELTEIVEGPRAGLAARFAEALTHGAATELEAVSREFERMGDLVAAVDAAAHAAVAHRRDDRKGSALTCAARAEGLAQRCGGASTPALRRASAPVPLTDREREIVMLIGQGMSSRAIAERLTLSVRTVEGHIYRAMAKTGAEDRDELARMLPGRSGT